MSVKLNRIYQGRVVSCLDEQGKDISNFEGVLWEHHQLFQDAVNYYLFALVAMSVEDDPVFGKIKTQLKTVWNDFERNGELRHGLKHSMFRIYSKPEILDEKKGFEFTEKLVLDNCSVKPEILQAALTHIADKCTGDVTQVSNTYFSRLCDVNYHGNWDFDEKAYEMIVGKNRLIEALYSESPVANIKALIPEMDIGWGDIKTQTGKFFEGKEALESLAEAIRFFIDSPTDYIKEHGVSHLSLYLSQIKNLGEISFGRNNKADKKRRNAMWLLRFFPDDFTVGLMKSIIKETDKEDLQTLPNVDYVKLSRGTRGYVFKSFTKLPIWQENSEWPEFDKDAFKSALTIINQFYKKSKERNEELEKYKTAVKWMEGISDSSKPPALPDADSVFEDDEESKALLPVLTTDSRWIKLNDLLHNELAVKNCWTEDDIVEYGLSERTIRSFLLLKSKWQEILAEERKKKTCESDIVVKLRKCLDKFQGDHSNEMGSAVLFQTLCIPENFFIWDDNCSIKGKFISDNILQDSVRYNSYKQRISELEEPIRITPADARLSRRLNNLCINGKEYGHKEQNVLIARIAVQENGKYKIGKVEINYSAPRLRRDGLIGNELGSFYFPEILQNLFEKEDFEQKFDPAVSLMPDWDKNGKLRFLLNFPVKLAVEKLHNNFDQRFRGKDEFYFANDVNSALLWPDYEYKKSPTWYQTGEDFYLVSVDFGQRSAGALVRIKVSTVQGKHSVFLGNDGIHDWYAERIYSELLRLPGEDAKVLNKGQFQKEDYGKNGRLADKSECEETIEIFRLLKVDNQMLYWNGKNIIPYFPQQNDKLLIAFRRAIGKLKMLDRWLWMFKSNANLEKLTEELSSADWLSFKTVEFIEKTEAELRLLLPQILVKIANRVLPVREKTWQWLEKESHNGVHYWQLCLTEAPGNKPKIRGQRGLSFARLTQLEEFRKRCQALNRVLMRKAGSEPLNVAQMRELVIPDCCPEVLRRLEEMKEQRINQTANMILAQALGVRHKVHASSLKERSEKGIHGEYEKIPGVIPASFIVLENLSRYRFSQDRSPYENSRLMKWSHRALVEKLKMLCKVIGMPVLEVHAAYSSKFSAESIPGFRAQECSKRDFDTFERLHKNLPAGAKDLFKKICLIHSEMCQYSPNATTLLPWAGGEIFVPFGSEDTPDLKQADINAAFNIGLRAVVNGKNILVNNRLSAIKKKDVWQVKRESAFAKMIFPEDIKISYSGESKSFGGNFFVIGCEPQKLGVSDDKIAHFAECSGQKGFLMFGCSIWHDWTLQLKRCLELNEKRLEKLIDKSESLF